MIYNIKGKRLAMNQQNDRPGTPATSQLPTHMRLRWRWIHMG